MFILFHHAMGFDDLVDAESFLNDRHNGAICEFWQGTLGEFSDNLGFLGDRP